MSWNVPMTKSLYDAEGQRKVRAYQIGWDKDAAHADTSALHVAWQVEQCIQAIHLCLVRMSFEEPLQITSSMVRTCGPKRPNMLRFPDSRWLIAATTYVKFWDGAFVSEPLWLELDGNCSLRALAVICFPENHKDVLFVTLTMQRFFAGAEPIESKLWLFVNFIR